MKDNYKNIKYLEINQTQLSYYQFEQGRKYLEKFKSIEINGGLCDVFQIENLQKSADKLKILSREYFG